MLKCSTSALIFSLDILYYFSTEHPKALNEEDMDMFFHPQFLTLF